MAEARAWMVACSLVAVVAAAEVHAQAPAAMPDVVVLRDGGLVRGTIVEAPADGPVRIQLVTGELRTYARAEVEYAGPEASRPAPGGASGVPDPSSVPPPPPSGAVTPGLSGDVPPPPPPAPPAPPSWAGGSYGAAGVPLRITSEVPGLELNILTGSTTIGSPFSYYGTTTVESYRALCRAPCETSLAPGTYGMMVRNQRGRSFPVRERVGIAQPSELAIGLHRPRGAWIAGSALAATGIVLAIVGFSQVSKYDILDESSSWNTYFGLGFAGLGLVGVGGLVIAFSDTRGTVEVRPLGYAPR